MSWVERYGAWEGGCDGGGGAGWGLRLRSGREEERMTKIICFDVNFIYIFNSWAFPNRLVSARVLTSQGV